MTNGLLLDREMAYVGKELACVLGLQQAMIIQQLHFLLLNDKCGKALEDGYKYVWNTYEQWKEQYFPFWETDTLKKYILGLEKKGLIISATIHNGYEKHKFYRINYDVLQARIIEYKSKSPLPDRRANFASGLELEQKETNSMQNLHDGRANKARSLNKEQSILTECLPHEQAQAHVRSRERTHEGDDEDDFFSAFESLEDNSGLDIDIPFVTDRLVSGANGSGPRQPNALALPEQPYLLPSLAPKAKRRRKAHTNGKASTPIPHTAFKFMFELCFMAETYEQQLILDSRQRGRVASALGKLRDAQASLGQIKDFKKWWDGTWMAKTKGSNAYQPPRPEQVVEHWNVAMNHLKGLEPRPVEVVVHNEGLMEAMMKRAEERKGGGA